MKNLKILTITFICILSFSCKKEKTITTENRLFGLIESNHDSLILIPLADTSFLFNRRISSLPDSFSLEMPPIRSQGNEGSCVAFSSAYAVRSYHFHRDAANSYYLSGRTLNLNNVFSPEFLYNSAKSSGDCETAGMTFIRALDLLKNTGVSTWQTMPYSDANGCSAFPNITQLLDAKPYKIDNYYRLSDISVDNIKQIIYNEQPILFGARVDSLFWKKGNFIWNSQNGRNVGRHAMVLCGWDDNKHAFKIMNSWGDNWGYSGFGWIDYDYLDNVLNGVPNAYEVFVLQTSLPSNNLDLSISNSSLYPSITDTNCQSFVTCDFRCSANNWNSIKNIPTFKDANGTTREINGVLEYDIISNWGAPNKFIHSGTPSFGAGGVLQVLKFYNINFSNGIVSGKIRIYGDLGNCNPLDNSWWLLTSFKYSLINTSLINASYSTDTIGTYTIGSNNLSTHQ